MKRIVCVLGVRSLRAAQELVLLADCPTTQRKYVSLQISKKCGGWKLGQSNYWIEYSAHNTIVFLKIFRIFSYCQYPMQPDSSWFQYCLSTYCLLVLEIHIWMFASNKWNGNGHSPSIYTSQTLLDSQLGLKHTKYFTMLFYTYCFTGNNYKSFLSYMTLNKLNLKFEGRY